MLTTEELIAKINAQHTAVIANQESNKETLIGFSGRMQNIEQAIAAQRGGPGGGHMVAQSWGRQIANSDGYKNFLTAGARGTAKISINNEINTVSGTDSLSAPDFQRDIVALPRQRMTVRQLLSPGRTESALIQYVRQTDRSLEAAPVAPGATKPESDLVFEMAEAPVRTIAHWIPVTRQAMDDVAQLGSLIDSELRYGLQLEEEHQFLGGDGTGQNILGLIPQATPYSAPFAVEDQQMLDVLLLAIAQAEASLIPADGVIVNSLDWRKMQALKDSQGRYIGSGPFGLASSLAWQLPVVATPSLEPGEFLVGGFRAAAQIFDRMDIEVLVSSEDRDNFIKNMLTVRAEERVALAVKRPQALVYGTYPSGV
jgi:HK97 family phage major capsid protein